MKNTKTNNINNNTVPSRQTVELSNNEKEVKMTTLQKLFHKLNITQGTMFQVNYDSNSCFGEITTRNGHYLKITPETSTPDVRKWTNNIITNWQP